MKDNRPVSSIFLCILKNLLFSKWTGIVLGAYALLLFTTVYYEAINERNIDFLDNNYFLTMTNIYLPFFLIVLILLVISPLFALDRKTKFADLGNTFKSGKRSWQKAKIAATAIYTIGITLVGFLLTFVATLIGNIPINPHAQVFASANPDIIMSITSFYIFSLLMVLICLLFISFLTLYISSKTIDVLVPFASTGLFCGLEQVLFLLDKTLYLRSFNIFMLLKPYNLLFSQNSLFAGTVIHIIVLSGLFIFMSVFLIWRIVVFGTWHPKY